VNLSQQWTPGDWFRVPSGAWPVVLEALRSLGELSPEAVQADVSYLLDRVEHHGQAWPSTMALARRWGWGRKRVRLFLLQHDPMMQRGQPRASEGPVEGQSRATQRKIEPAQSHDEGQRGASDGPDEGQRGATRALGTDTDTDTDQTTVGQLALTQPPVSKPDEWEQLRDHLVSLGRKGAARLTRTRGDGLELAKLLKSLGLTRAQQLLTLAYTSQQDPHPFNRERGKGHPPLDTLRRHGAKYLERSDEAEENRQQVAASQPSWEQLCRWYDDGRPPGPERERVRAMGWEVWCARLDPMMRHRHAQTYAQEAGA